jgi:hypothetical protein
MRVAEDFPAQDVGMLSNLRRGVEAAARVIEIHMTVGIQSRVLRLAKVVEAEGLAILRMRVEKSLELSQRMVSTS